MRLALSYQEAADAIGVDESTIRRWARTRGLPVCKIGRRRLIRPEALADWLAGFEERTELESPALDPVVSTIVRRSRRS